MVHKPFDEKKVVVPKRQPAPYDRGHIGRPIGLYANWFLMTTKDEKNIKIYHFDVSIDLAGKEAQSSVATGNKSIPGLAPEETSPEAASPSGAKSKGKRRRGRKGKKEGEGSEMVAEESGIPIEGVTNQTAAGPKSRIPKFKLRQIFNEFIKQNEAIFRNHPFAFDGEKNAYSVTVPAQLKGPFSKTVEIAERGVDHPKTLFRVKLQFVAGGNTNLMEYFNDIKAGKQLVSKTSYMSQALEVIFNYGRCMRFETIGRNKFFSQTDAFGRKFPLAGVTEGRSGFYGSLRPAVGKWKDATPLMLNLDVAHAVFYQEKTVIDFIRKNSDKLLLNLSQNCTPEECEGMEKILVKNLIKVEAKHYKGYTRKFTIRAIGPETSFHKFEIDGKTTTVKEYFKKCYNKDIEFPNLPCLKVGKNGENCMPMELCTIAPNQKVKGKLTSEQTAEFIKRTAVRPVDRLKTISSTMSINKFSEDEGLKALGINITPEPISLDGRVLPPPAVEMDRNVIVRDGKWDPRNNKFHTSAPLRDWAVLNFSREKFELLDRFVVKLKDMARSKGMEVDDPMDISYHYGQDPEDILKKLLKKFSSCKFVLCVIDNSKKDYYAIKTTGDRELKIVTQCVKQFNVFKCSDATISNILLKINAKLGGTCFTSNYDRVPHGAIPNIQGYNGVAEVKKIPQIFKDNVMIMGADVNHPGAGDKLSPSLVAVVGSCNKDASRYALEIRHQIHRTELISDLKNITKKLLVHYRAETKCVPRKIIMYRDGVSESQFVQVLSGELLAMRQACTDLDQKYQPSITFICVQKRHNTRLFVRNPRDACGKAGNIPPGTVVDDVITNPIENDFFLCSHEGIQGTSKPAHYHVLWDDSDFSADVIQMLTYSQCHSYTRCTRSVSIPTPAYYAHLAAFRAKIYYEAKLKDAPVIRRDENPATNQKYISFLDEICNVSADGIGKNLFYV